MIKVSVIVPVYKVPLDFLRECLDSLVAQTMQECEFILISDGAPDAECSVCEEYAARDPRFKFFRREHAGVSATRNFGIEQAQGEYITFVDSDDKISECCCIRAYQQAIQNLSDIVLFDFDPTEWNYPKTTISNSSIIINKTQIDEILKQIIKLNNNHYVAAVSTWCKLFNRKFIQRFSIVFPENSGVCEDRFFSFSAFWHASKITYLKEILYTYNKRENSISNSFKKTFLESHLNYLYGISELTNKYDNLIGTFIIEIFFDSWNVCFFNKSNKDKLLTKIKTLSHIVNSIKFQKALRNANTKNFPCIIKLETKLLKKRSTLPIWLHAIKWKFTDIIMQKLKHD